MKTISSAVLRLLEEKDIFDTEEFSAGFQYGKTYAENTASYPQVAAISELAREMENQATEPRVLDLLFSLNQILNPDCDLDDTALMCVSEMSPSVPRLRGFCFGIESVLCDVEIAISIKKGNFV
jgi:hypothetical protein